MKKQIFRTAKKILPLLGLILLIIYIFFTIPPSELADAIGRITQPIFIIFAVTLMIPRFLIRNYAWQIILKEQNIKINFWQSLKVFFIGYFWGSFTPGYYGQLMRIPYLKDKTGEPYGKLFVNTMIEIMIRGLSIYLMIIVGALLFLRSNIIIFYITVAWFVIFTSVLLYFIKKERGEKLFFTLIKYFMPKRLKKNLNSFVYTFYNDFPRIRVLFLPIFLSVLTWIIIFTEEYMIVLSMGLLIPYGVFLLVFPIANVAGFIPISFGGVGIREIVAIEIFIGLYAVTRAEILIVSLLGYILVDVVPGLIGFILSLTETTDKKSFLIHLKQ